MPQTKMSPTFTLFPDFIALVPLELIAGATPTITNIGDIDATNSFVINDASADTDLLLSEGGLNITYTKTSDQVQAFDAGGLGDLDDVTVQRALTMEMGVNGYSHDILALMLGLNPKTDIDDTMKFLKDNTTGVFAAGAKLRGNITKEKFFFIARIPLDEAGAGDLYVVSPKVVVEDGDTAIPMLNQKVTQTINIKGLKLLDSAQLSTLQGLVEAISNGFEMLFMFNAGTEAFV